MGGLWSKNGEGTDHSNPRKRPAKVVVPSPPYRQAPYVLKRVSSMFLDEDDDCAHEFYEECKVVYQTECLEGVVRWTMRRIKHNIRPQGEIELKPPRLHVDFPVILLENTT